MATKGILQGEAENGNALPGAPVSVPTPPIVPVPVIQAPALASAPKKYYGSIHPGKSQPVPDEFAVAVKKLEAAIGCPIWLLIQNEDMSLDAGVFRAFRDARKEIEENRPVALLIESPGGEAEYAYRIGRLFQRRASTFTVIVPQWAKSAATLLSLGGSKIIMGRDAELGPLDVQIWDDDKEEFGSALNAVQSLERLNAFVLTALDQSMQLLLSRTRKKSDALLPLVFDHTSKFVRPLLEKIDTIELTRKSRELKVAEQYAVRLMKSNYSWSEAERIGRALVERYPTHGFVIDREETEAKEPMGQRSSEMFGLGLKIAPPDPALDQIIDEIIPYCDNLSVVGTLKEV
jgi:hypothetical protein